MNQTANLKVARTMQLSLLLLLLSSANSIAQEQHTPQLPAPPPLRVISQTERTHIEESGDTKARIRKTLELAAIHLQHAEEQTAQLKFDNALMELGGYLALIEDGLKFLSRMDRDRDKTRDLYKRIELTLRADAPRLLNMRRNAPLEYAVRIKEVEEFARAGRTEALDSFYGHTVMREGKQKPSDSSNKPPDKP